MRLGRVWYGVFSMVYIYIYIYIYIFIFIVDTHRKLSPHDRVAMFPGFASMEAGEQSGGGGYERLDLSRGHDAHGAAAICPLSVRPRSPYTTECGGGTSGLCGGNSQAISQWPPDAVECLCRASPCPLVLCWARKLVQIGRASCRERVLLGV